MAITLGGITLPDVIIDNEFGDSLVDSIVEPTLGGTLLVWEQTREYRNIDLVGRNDSAWISRLDLQSLYTISKVLNASYTLTYEGTNYNVRFRHKSQPVLTATPIIERPNATNTDWYNNLVIKLMEV